MANVKLLELNGSKKRTIKRDKPQKNCLRIGVFFRKFSAYTSLHGFVYISEEELCLTEKLFWIFVVINVFVICGLQTTSLVGYWNEGNILVTKESASTKVWDIPFPALTICSENQINSVEMNTFANQSQNTKNFTNLKHYVDMLCDGSYSISPQHRPNSAKLLEENILQFAFKNLVLECERTILRVFWMKDELTSPCRFFQPIVLSTGVCYSLNMISHESLFDAQYYQMRLQKWLILLRNAVSSLFVAAYYTYHFCNCRLNHLLNRTSQSKIRRKFKKPPWHVGGDMLSNSITMSINLRYKNFEQYCQITGNGVKIFVHNPLEHPLLSNYLYVTGDNSYLILITPISVITSDSLVKWKPAHRGCFYRTEKVLRYFKIYTRSNCELECRINKTIERCGCVPFYLPRFTSTDICSVENLECVKNAASTQFSIFANKNSYVEENNSYLKYCQCLPSCSELTYTTEMSQTAANWTHIHKVNSNISNDYETIVVITLHFKKKSVDKWVRSPVIRFNELTANIGGIVSLYTGCSIVSLFEIMCFMILKKWLQNENPSGTATTMNEQHKQSRRRRSSLRMIRKNNHVNPVAPLVAFSPTRF